MNFRCKNLRIGLTTLMVICYCVTSINANTVKLSEKQIDELNIEYEKALLFMAREFFYEIDQCYSTDG